jgi:predicted alpha-1,2-mannosidase
MMIGYHAVPVIVDAFLKNIPMDIEKAYEACRQTAMSNAWDLPEYKKYGYVPSDGLNKGYWSVSKTMEYAYDDYCVAMFAKTLHKTDDYNYFFQRSMNWKNHYDKSSTFFRPKDKSGEFVKNFAAKKYTEYFCESNAWQYFWSVQHQLDSLIKLTGKEIFEAKLDSMFSYYPAPEDKLPIFSTGMIGQYAHGNEPGHHVAYLYNYIGKPHKTQKLVREIMATQYNNRPDGFCGNEDCGQMSGWYVWSALGFYPVNPVDRIYHLGSPALDNAKIKLPDGQLFEISVHNNSDENIYIQSIKFNGKNYNKLSITHQEILNGGKMEFFMGNTPVPGEKFIR